MRHFKGYWFFYLSLGLLALGLHRYAASRAHILFSIIAFAILTLAALQALVTALQNYALKQRPLQTYPLLRLLPPVESMQATLFKILWAGFFLLSLVFLGAFLYLPDILQHAQFSKLLLYVFAWVLFATLLYGYHKSGWSSDMVILRTIIGVLLLAASYSVSHLVFR